MKLRADETDIKKYVEEGWWEASKGLADFVRKNAQRNPSGIAYQTQDIQISWNEYFHSAVGLAQEIRREAGRGGRVLVWLPEAGLQELKYLSEVTGASMLLSKLHNPFGKLGDISEHLNLKSLLVEDICSNHIVDAGGSNLEESIGPSDLWFLNSTSGTTGLPKCVMQTQNRWFYFHRKAVEFGHLTEKDIWMSVVPAPFGFGLWTAHVTPTLLGIPCLLQERFNALEAAQEIERHQVSVLCAVSSQFVMILDASSSIDLSSLRVIFTGGEAISPTRAQELEEKSGCRVLNFYGSNETGTLSGTTVHDPAEKRYTSAGKVIPEMQVRLYDPTTGERTADIGKGQPACKGPALSLGYWEDDDANKELMTEDGWFLMGDLVEIDSQGWLKVTGRVSDFIIRGGKNISAVAIEREVELHPKVALVAVVPKPNKKLGETAAAYVQLHVGQSLSLEELQNFLSDQGVSIEWWPETLNVLKRLPLSSGGKVAKGELKELIKSEERNQ
ncbi:MAG: class I adenylate-forming enzyme family protein [Acidimicrobiales bacterium]